MSFAQAYETLSDLERDALQASCEILVDEVLMDIRALEDGEAIKHTFIGFYLPCQYQAKYTTLFVKQFLLSLVVVGWKLSQPSQLRLACLAEELAAYTLIERAKAVIELEADDRGDEPPDVDELYEDFIDEFFEDTDFLFLYDHKYDGIDQTSVGERLGMTSLSFSDWFHPFYEGSDEMGRSLHPYLLDDSQGEGMTGNGM